MQSRIDGERQVITGLAGRCKLRPGLRFVKSSVLVVFCPSSYVTEAVTMVFSTMGGKCIHTLILKKQFSTLELYFLSFALPIIILSVRD